MLFKFGILGALITSFEDQATESRTKRGLEIGYKLDYFFKELN